ncbi:MAG: LamG domain-containing protein, partial [Clostridia bacterium]|nr:LamG domain-containing protein [Clostridia bacterium]
GVINTGTEGGANVTVTATVTVVAVDSFLLVEYDFDDETLADTSGNYAATTEGALTYEDAPAGYGKALVLPGGASSSANYASIPTEALARDDLGVVTVSAFIKPASGASNWTMLTLNSSTLPNVGYDARFINFAGSPSYTAIHPKPAVNWTGSEHASQGGGLTAGEWTHVVYVLDKTSAKIYKNGVLVGTSTSFPIAEWENNYAFIGASGYQDPMWTGSIDNIKIYSVALTDEEVAALDTLPEEKSFEVSYLDGSTEIASQTETAYVGGTYALDAGKIYANGKIYSHEAVSEAITASTETISVALTLEQTMAAATFATTTGSAIAWDGSTYVAAANNGSGAGLTSDADGNSTATGTVWQNYGSIRTATVTFNTITPTAGKAYVLHLPTYMVDVNTTAGTSGEMRITAGYDGKYIVSANALAGNGETRYSAYDPSTTEYIFDVTDAIQNGTLSFTLDTPVGGVGFPTLEMAAAGGLWAGCAPYITEEDGVTLTGDTSVSKLTVAGNEVTSGAVVLAGYGAKAYITPSNTDYANFASVVCLDNTAVATVAQGVASQVYSIASLTAPAAITVSYIGLNNPLTYVTTIENVPYVFAKRNTPANATILTQGFKIWQVKYDAAEDVTQTAGYEDVVVPAVSDENAFGVQLQNIAADRYVTPYLTFRAGDGTEGTVTGNKITVTAPVQ